MPSMPTARIPSRTVVLAAVLLAAAGAGPSRSRAQASALVTGADNGGNTAAVNIFRPDGTAIDSFSGAGLAFTGGIRIGTGDVNGDGASDILAAEGVGGSTVRVFTGPSHVNAFAVSPFGASYGLGLFVAGADLNRDGRADLVVGAGGGTGSTPRVQVVNLATRTPGTLADFPAFGAGFTGGVRVAAGDINRDGYPDVIAGQGEGGGGVRIFNGRDLAVSGATTLLASFTPSAPAPPAGCSSGRPTWTAMVTPT